MAQADANFAIKLALENIQYFDGQTPVMFTWIKQIEKAVASLDAESLPRLLKLLRYKVRDNASDSIRNINFVSIAEFTIISKDYSAKK